MKKQILLALALAAVLAAPAAAATPPPDVMAPINAVLAATNADKIAGLDSYYTADAVVVDEFAPYVWTGQTAGTHWWTALDRLGVQMGSSAVHATALAVEHFEVKGDSAYVVIPLEITYTLKGKPQHETGLWTVTLRRSGGAWQIATQTWGTSTSTM
jgi:ketosteroid isomerase-like protein